MCACDAWCSSCSKLISEEEIREMVSRFDYNNNSSVDYDEICQMNEFLVSERLVAEVDVLPVLLT